jgi:hypothetical protein
MVRSRVIDVHEGHLLSLAYFAIGMSPIAALALSIAGLWTLPTGTLLLVLPMGLLGIALARRYPHCGRLALAGLAAGLIAVFLYDCTRVPFIMAGAWGDFIPKIGGWLLSTDKPNRVVGYLWRYIGNGGGMGMAFTFLFASFLRTSSARINFRSGVLFGVAIWLCLLVTILVSSRGEQMLFKLTPVSFVLSLLGHLVYGAVLGVLVHRWQVGARTSSFASRLRLVVTVPPPLLTVNGTRLQSAA